MSPMNPRPVNTKELFLALLPDLGIDLVCEVGSMNGDDALAFRARLPQTRIIALEPNPSNLQRMRADPRLAAAGIEVALQRSRVLVEILVGSELRGVHEDRDHHRVALLASRLDEAEVPRVQRSHRRHDADRQPRPPRRFDLASRFGDLPGDDQFLKFFAHGTQERHSGPFFSGMLDQLFATLAAQTARRGMELYFVSAWQMFLAIENILQGADPRAALTPGTTPHTATPSSRV